MTEKKGLAYFNGKRSPDWETPQSLFDELNKIHKFTLDPCSNHENAKVEKHYTKEEDGLSKSWKNEVVFMNPPYGRKISPWVKKAHNELVKHNTKTVALLPSKTGPKWFQNYVKPLAEITYLPGRQKFGGEKRPAPFDSIIAIWRNEPNEWYFRLQDHIDHEIVITHYKRLGEICIECETCFEILHSQWEYPKELSIDWEVKE